MLAPTRAAHQDHVIARSEATRRPSASREEVPLGCNLPVQLCGYMGTDVEATPYREIPTDGIAVLGMT